MMRPPVQTSKCKDYGDFQTPPALVAEVLDTLERIGGHHDRVLEPTCGRGNFIAGLLDRAEPPHEVLAFEIQADHAEVAQALKNSTSRSRLVVQTADLFGVDLETNLDWQSRGPLLVVGNLPWVTTAALGASGGSNGPARSNIKGLRGIEARTGASNFDISEAIWIKLIRELAPDRPTIALLCKSAVARAVLRSIDSLDLPITRATIWRIDAPRWFRASVDACLLRVEVGPGPFATEAEVFEQLSDLEPGSTLGIKGDRLIADARAYRAFAFADGTCPLAWRQGLKHDASPVMELNCLEGGVLLNKLGEVVNVEEEYVFPLLKGSDLGGGRTSRPCRAVIVTQRSLGEDTRSLEHRAPQLWAYLLAHREIFDRRKSSIYRGRLPFCLFGVGDYSFAPFKVAVSGLHKIPRFRLVEGVDAQPTMLDDTCYFLPCQTLEQATVLVDLLNSPVALGLIRALAFTDAKRPITKGLLQRIDLEAILDHNGQSFLWRRNWTTDWIKARPNFATH